MSPTRFITQYPGYKVQIRPQRQRSLGDGSIEVTQEPIYAEFKTVSEGAFIFENEEVQARKVFNFHGNTQEMDQATPSDALNRLAVYDTDEAAEIERWDEKIKMLAEGFLINIATVNPSELFQVTTTPISAPFPNYDNFDGDAEQLAMKIAEDGFDLGEVLYYERTFGRKRADVIEALETLAELEKEHVVSA